jgi:hypothetical protein
LLMEAMMRPYVMTQDRGLQPDQVCHLYVHRDTMNPRAWVLSWSVPGSWSSVGAEGECSRRYFRTMGDAIAFGARQYGEAATRAYWDR